METSLTTRREPEKVRLIDANAILEELKKKQSERPDSPEDWADYGFWIMQKVIESAPTVETTDDVLMRIGRHPTVFFGNDEWNAYVMEDLNKVCN